MSFDIDKVRADFPILARQVNGRPLVYLDSGASAQKPRRVIEAITRAYEDEYANVHRGLHFLSNLATENYERVRGIIARFLNAPREDEVIFTSGATEGINLVSYGWAAPRLQPGDEIVLSVLEHHANIVPWHFLRERQGVVLKWVDPEPDGSLPPEKVLAAVGPRTRLIAVTHMSNVTGTVVDVGAIARGTDVPVLADGSQASVHMPVDLAALGVDFYCITGHKLYGPSGSGAIWIRAARQAEMRPFMGGGDMIRTVTREGIDYADPPLRFEAGTPGIANQIGLGAALEYLMELGMENVASHERALRDRARDRLRSLNWLQLQGDSPDKGAIFSMTMQGAHAHDISTILDKRGIAVRAGTHCAMPLMEFYGVSASARASFAMYNTLEDVDALIDGLAFCRELFA
ncbi:cysteine desulfurase [Paracoccus halophilus]|uniref:Cysteine desulfurase n=1 Tax=Paracoccus halophilus TaxID=376733 RepID=A0A099F0E0_9RHOB|nr:cysteine desulfurase [Paracoccus halophilus]KGJ03721.1 cysteine desulfurase [Paracoccus halophilus]SFA57395.1 cysteine desulfurase [Paracoccus halophilus]